MCHIQTDCQADVQPSRQTPQRKNTLLQLKVLQPKSYFENMLTRHDLSVAVRHSKVNLAGGSQTFM